MILKYNSINNTVVVSLILRIRIRIRIYLLAGRNLLWDILRLPSSRRAALGLYVILTLWRTRGANQPPYMHRCIGARRAMHYATGDDSIQVLKLSPLSIHHALRKLVTRPFDNIGFRSRHCHVMPKTSNVIAALIQLH